MKKSKQFLAIILAALMLVTSMGEFIYPITAQAAEEDAGTTTTPSGVIFADSRTDFRDESIYFVMTTRFYDGDPNNNVQCWDGTQYDEDGDPEWRGDFKGLAEKLDYIKALGFTAVWITPVVENISGFDYHGYHASDFSKIDPRYESSDFTYQDFIDAAHAKGLKVIQDVVFNHTGNFGEKNLLPMFEKTGDLSTPDCLQKIPGSGLPENYDSLNPDAQYQARLALMKEDINDINNIYHHEKDMSWEGYTCQTGQIAGDCVDLNTENPVVYKYLQDAYNQYIDMGVDAFRVDTVKHISRLTFNNALVQPFYDNAAANGNDSFYMFGEVCSRYRQVWNSGIPALSAPFYTWKESKDYTWSDTDRLVNESSVKQNYEDNSTTAGQPISDNALLNGNDYHAPDMSKNSGLGVIDFPMHWNFTNANDAFRVAVEGDQWYNDATWNVTYVDSHDYAPDGAPEYQRFNQPQDVWAENLSLMFTFRGIPCIYYGSEIEFQKGALIDKGPNLPLSETGRAYFGDNIEGDVIVGDFGEYFGASGAVEETLNYPLSLHIQRLNQIRQAVPALRKGQYSVQDISGNQMAYKRRYTDDRTDSFALVTVSGTATFSNIPNGTYVDCITGDTKNVTNGSLTADCSGKGNLRVYVLDTQKTPAPGKVGQDGKYLYTSGPVENTQKQSIYFKNEAGWNSVTANLYDNSGNLVESIPMLKITETDYACNYTGNQNGLKVIFTNGSSTTPSADFMAGGYYNNNGYISQYPTGGTDIIQVTEVKLSPKTVNLEFGKTATITAQVLPADAKNKNLTWTTSNAQAATVRNGVVTAQGEGTAIITAISNNGISDTVTVNVSVPPFDYEEVPEGYTAIYFEKPTNWGNKINCYLYYDDGVTVAGGWPGAGMIKLPNGVYQYIFETVENKTVKVLFNDGSNQAPASVGFDVINYGLYNANGHKETIVPKPIIPPVSDLKLTSLAGSIESPQPLGTTIKFTAAAEGGEGELQYKFYRVQNGKTTVFRDYNKSNIAYCNPAVAGDYEVFVDVKDAKGNTATTSIAYTWTAPSDKPEISSLTASHVSPQPLGITVKFTAAAKGGEGELQYKFYRVQNGVTTVFRDFNKSNVAYCNPAKDGAYTIVAEVKDAKGNTAKKEIEYRWGNSESGLQLTNITASSESPQPLGTTIKFTATAEGGEGTLQYKFYRIQNGVTTVFRDFNKSNVAYCNPAKDGAYTIVVEVKDAKGNVDKKEIAYKWGNSASDLKFTKMAASTESPCPLGITVKFTAIAENGEGELQYKFYRVQNGKTTIFRDYNKSNIAYCNPPAGGDYTVYVDVKDSSGKVVTGQINFKWN